MLAGLGAWLGKLVLGFIWSKLAVFFGGLITGIAGAIAHGAARKKSKEDADTSVDPLKKAETGKEIDDATDDALGGF